MSDAKPTSALSLSDLAALNAEIAALVRARIPLESQLSRLGRELPGTGGALATRIATRMEGGASLLQALDEEGDRLPPVYRAVVAAGMHSGRLGAALEALVESASRMEHVCRVTGVALIYPTLVALVAWGALGLAATSILPNFAWFELPHTDRPMGRSLEIYQWSAVLLAAIATVALGWMVYWWWRSARGTHHATRVPGFGWLAGARHWGHMATVSELLRVQVEQGVPLDEAVQVAAKATPSVPTRQALESWAENLQSGNAETPTAVPPLIALALAHGGNRPLVESSLAAASQSYRGRAERAAEWATEYLPLLVVAGVGGLLVLALAVVCIFPYASMLHELAGTLWW